ncbi:hypothetical protein EC957_002309, partial [Mortierella hygrophila]
MANNKAVLRLAQVDAEYSVLAYEAMLENKASNAVYFEDPLAFWRNMEGVDSLTNMFYLARMYLTTQATSSESERLF